MSDERKIDPASLESLSQEYPVFDAALQLRAAIIKQLPHLDDGNDKQVLTWLNEQFLTNFGYVCRGDFHDPSVAHIMKNGFSSPKSNFEGLKGIELDTCSPTVKGYCRIAEALYSLMVIRQPLVEKFWEVASPIVTAKHTIVKEDGTLDTDLIAMMSDPSYQLQVIVGEYLTPVSDKKPDISGSGLQEAFGNEGKSAALTAEILNLESTQQPQIDRLLAIIANPAKVAAFAEPATAIETYAVSRPFAQKSAEMAAVDPLFAAVQAVRDQKLVPLLKTLPKGPEAIINYANWLNSALTCFAMIDTKNFGGQDNRINSFDELTRVGFGSNLSSAPDVLGIPLPPALVAIERAARHLYTLMRQRDTFVSSLGAKNQQNVKRSEIIRSAGQGAAFSADDGLAMQAWTLEERTALANLVVLVFDQERFNAEKERTHNFTEISALEVLRTQIEAHIQENPEILTGDLDEQTTLALMHGAGFSDEQKESVHKHAVFMAEGVQSVCKALELDLGPQNIFQAMYAAIMRMIRALVAKLSSADNSSIVDDNKPEEKRPPSPTLSLQMGSDGGE